ncbi:hypothetical protein SAG0163_01610 [Streptococcus agalactiae MRI Z1-215]|nr:hypothetical protein SAG0163_01610 [Streptococcus agalactiae MRI Z1-215]
MNDLAEFIAHNLNQGRFMNVVWILATINRFSITRTLVVVVVDPGFLLWAKIMLSPTSSTKDQSRKEIFMTNPILISFIRTLMASHFLDNIESFLVYDGFMSILENQPIFF